MKPERLQQLKTAFRDLFGESTQAVAVRSPGRVNLIGEHTDYNEGFVLPAAVDKAALFIVAPRSDHECRFFAADLKDGFSTSLNHLTRSDKGWPNYLLGVISELHKDGRRVPGCDLVFGGDVPIGAGMSSSAALECGFAHALNLLFEFGLSKLDLARLGQRAENNFVGVNCGIMDQFVNIHGESRSVLKIDCRSLEHEYYPFDRDDLNIVLCETASRRSLASSEYNVRRQQCEAGVRLLQESDRTIQSLRDVRPEMLEAHRGSMDAILYQRCSYVVAENARVLGACEDLQRGDFASFGQKMFQSHIGLRDGYQVSSPDLDFLVDVAGGIDGVLGSRMMGAGFGGCTINLVEQAKVSAFADVIRDRYARRTGTPNNVYVTRIESGTAQVPLD